MDQERRHLVAVLADLVGYSRLMADDESGTLARLKSLRSEIVDPIIAGALASALLGWTATPQAG